MSVCVSIQRRCLLTCLFVYAVAGRGLSDTSSSIFVHRLRDVTLFRYDHHAGRHAPRSAVSSPAETIRQRLRQKQREQATVGSSVTGRMLFSSAVVRFSAEGARISTKSHVRLRRNCVRDSYRGIARGSGRCCREASAASAASRRSFGAHEVRRVGERFLQPAAVRPRSGGAHQRRFHSPHPSAFA